MSKPKRLDEFLAWKPEPLKSYIDKGLLYERTRMIIYGKYKSLKSMLVQDLAIALAKGEPWLGINTNPEGTSVFYLQLELSEVLWQRRVVRRIGGEVKTKKDLVFWTEHFLKIDSDTGMGVIREYLDEFKPQVLIIDPLYKVMAGDMSDNHAIQGVSDSLDKLLNDYRLSIILLHHSRKPGANETKQWGSDNMLGGTLLSAWGDSIIEVNRETDGLRIDMEVIRHAEEELSAINVRMTKDLKFVPRELNL